MSGNMNEVKKIKKLNQYFYMTPDGTIMKYKKYCVVNNCKLLSSFNYANEKKFYIAMNIKKIKWLTFEKDINTVINMILLI